MNAIRKKFDDLGLDDSYAIIRYARKGVRPAVFYSFASTANISEKNLAALLHVHPRTISNYRVQKKSMNPVESEHLLKLISLYAKGEELFGTIEEFTRWLDQPFEKGQETPMAWLNTPGGVDLVSDELDRIAHGYVA